MREIRSTTSSVLVGDASRWAAIIAIAIGVALGALVYLGLSRITPKVMFQSTNVLVALMAAGIAGKISVRLSKMNLSPLSSATWFDSSNVITPNGIIDALLHAIIGYKPQISQAQVVGFMVGLVILAVLYVVNEVRQKDKLGHKAARHGV